MFSKLTNFEYERNTKEAFGFYIAYLFLCMLLGGLIGGIAVGIFKIENHFAYRLGTLISVILCLVLSGLIAKQKGILSNYKSIILIIVSGLLAILSGGLGGLIPVSYLSTLKNNA